MDRRMTPKGQMSGNGAGPAIAHLPPMMKAMFAPDAPIKYIPPIVKRKMPPYSGCAQFVSLMDNTPPEPRPEFEDPLQRKARLLQERIQKNEEETAAKLALWDPQNPPSPVNGELTQDAYKTLFVARLSHDTTSHKLRREFQQFGPIKTLRLVQDKNNECRGYAFIEYENEADMKEAYKRSDGRKIDGKRVVVDVERGRTVRKWKPRRFGGGLGNTRESRKKGEKAAPVPSGRAGPGNSSSGHYGAVESSRVHEPRRERERSRSRDRGGSDRAHGDRGERSDRGDRDRGERDRGYGGRDRGDKGYGGDRDRSDRGDRERRRRSRSR